MKVKLRTGVCELKIKLSDEEMAGISAAIYHGLESGKLTLQAAEIAAEFVEQVTRNQQAMK